MFEKAIVGMSDRELRDRVIQRVRRSKGGTMVYEDGMGLKMEDGSVRALSEKEEEIVNRILRV